MSKLNCWEFMKCGREIGGINTRESGVCPVATETSADELNSGVNGGRICWVIAEIACGGGLSCTGKKRESACFSCQFRYKVTCEEGWLKVCKATGELLAGAGAHKEGKKK